MITKSPSARAGDITLNPETVQRLQQTTDRISDRGWVEYTVPQDMGSWCLIDK